MSWLDDLLKQTEDNEAPERYFWWSGLAAISAVARKNVWLDKFYYKLYPNIYVVLISDKSGAKKGLPVSICKRLLQHAKLARIISGCNSIQGVIEVLSEPVSLNGHAIKEAHGILLSGELDSFFTDDPKTLTYLTDLYNTHEHEEGWEKTLKSGKTNLISPCLTLLVASNEALFGNVVKQRDIEGGFIGRTAFVRETKSRKPPNPLVDPPEFRIDIPRLAERLKEISSIRDGEFKWTPKPKKLYKEWYEDKYKEESDDQTGTFNRLGDQVLKVAMLIALANRSTLEFEVEDIQLAIKNCEACVKDAMGISSNFSLANGDRPNTTRLVLRCIFAADAKGKRISQAAILSSLQQYQLTVPHVESAIRDLLAMGIIKKNMITGEGNIYSRTIYELTDLGRNQRAT